MQDKISWSYATILSLISGGASFFIFFFVEIIRGDILKDTLDSGYQLEQYFNINIIIWTGILAVFGISLLINIVALQKYALGPKIASNIGAMIYTFIVLFMISSLSVIIVYSKEYSQLDLGTQISLSVQFFSLFSIYILPYPTLFWFIALFIYHIILIIFIRFFYYEKRKIKR